MSEQIEVNTNKQLALAETFSPAELEPYTDGFVDVGALIQLEIPFYTPRFRGKPLLQNPKPTFDHQDVPTTNRMPLFGFIVDPFFNHDFSGEFSPFLYPDPTWASNNTQLTIRPQGMEHTLVRHAPTFLAWSGGLDYMITVNSTALVQGQLSIIRAKYMGAGPFKWENIQLETDERDNCQIINLSSEKRVAEFSTYTETTMFINSMQYNLSRSSLFGTPRNQKPMNALRNVIFVRADTDINTLSPNGGNLTFRIYMKPSKDFQWMYPTVPRRPDTNRIVSAVDKKEPFTVKDTLVVAQRPYPGTSSSRPLIVDDTQYEATVIVPSSGLTVRNYPSNVTAFVDMKKYIPGSFPEWTAITGYSYGWTSEFTTLQINVRIDTTFVLVREYTMAELVYGAVLFETYRNPGVMESSQPPYFYP